MVSATTPNLLPHLASGKVRLLAIGAEERLGGAFAQTPTWREQGVDYVNDSFQGVAAASGLSPEHRAFWLNALRRVANSTEWRQFVALNQWQPYFLGPDETTREIQRQVRQTRALLAELKLDLGQSPQVANVPKKKQQTLAQSDPSATSVR